MILNHPILIHKDGQLLWYKQDMEGFLNKDFIIVHIKWIDMEKLFMIYYKNGIFKLKNGNIIKEHYN